jgi:hypothetical protein
VSVRPARRTILAATPLLGGLARVRASALTSVGPPTAPRGRITAVAAGWGRPPYAGQEGTIAFLSATAHATSLCQDKFGEDQGDSGGAPQPPISLCSVGAYATDPLVPVRDGPFWGDPARWILWREANTVHAIDTAGRTLALALPAPPSRMLRPALQRAGAEVHVMCLSPDRRRLDRLAFPREPSGKARIDGSTALPGGVTSGAAGFAPGGDCAVLLIPGTDALTLLLARPDRKEPPRAVSLPGLRCPDGMEPAIAEHPDGSIHCAILAEAGGQLSVVEARFPPDTAPPTKTIRPVSHAVAPWAGALCYWRDACRVLVSLSGRWLAGAGPVAPLSARIFSGAEPMAPLVLVPTARGALCLTLGAAGFPRMAPV